MQRDGSSEYVATIELADSPESTMSARVALDQGTLSVVASGQEIGTWSLSTIDVSRLASIFTLDVDGERLLIEVDDPDRFAEQLGLDSSTPEDSTDGSIANHRGHRQPSPATGPRHRQAVGPAPWWQFWRAEVWREWMGRRRRWQEYRTTVDPVRSQIRDLRLTIAEKERALAEAERNLGWARELRPIEAPIHLRGAETAVASFSGVQLYEPQGSGRTDGWMPVDRGTLYVTDRRLVFSGEHELRFEYVELTSAVKTPIGLLVGMAYPRHEYVISGPVDQLVVSMEAAHRGGRGLSPTAPLAEKVEQIREDLETAEEGLAGLKDEVSAIETPTRPISPAWAPVAVLAAVALVGSGFGGLESASDTTPAAEADATAAESDTEVLGLVVGSTNMVWSLELVGSHSDPGSEQDDPSGDGWVRIRNTGSSTADLSGWALSNRSGSHRYELPRGLTVGPGAEVTVHPGCGTDRATELYVCQPGTDVWGNDGAALVDPGGRTIARYDPVDPGSD